MREYLEPILGATGAMIAQFAITLVAIAILILAVFWLIRIFTAGRLGTGTMRGRQPRLSVLDALPIDQRRRLVLIRRDNVEHLLLIGGPSDIVVEGTIHRQPPPQRRAEAARAAGQPAPTPRYVPPPEPQRGEPVDEYVEEPPVEAPARRPESRAEARSETRPETRPEPRRAEQRAESRPEARPEPRAQEMRVQEARAHEARIQEARIQEARGEEARPPERRSEEPHVELRTETEAEPVTEERVGYTPLPPREAPEVEPARASVRPAAGPALQAPPVPPVPEAPPARAPRPISSFLSVTRSRHAPTVEEAARSRRGETARTPIAPDDEEDAVPGPRMDVPRVDVPRVDLPRPADTPRAAPPIRPVVPPAPPVRVPEYSEEPYGAPESAAADHPIRFEPIFDIDTAAEDEPRRPGRAAESAAPSVTPPQPGDEPVALDEVLNDEAAAKPRNAQVGDLEKEMARLLGEISGSRRT